MYHSYRDSISSYCALVRWPLSYPFFRENAVAALIRFHSSSIFSCPTLCSKSVMNGSGVYLRLDGGYARVVFGLDALRELRYLSVRSLRVLFPVPLHLVFAHPHVALDAVFEDNVVLDVPVPGICIYEGTNGLHQRFVVFIFESLHLRLILAVQMCGLHVEVVVVGNLHTRRA